MKKFCLVAPFESGEKNINGQTVKALSYKAVFEKEYGADCIYLIDTSAGKKRIIETVIKMVYAFFSCKNIIIFPAENGLQLFAPLCSFLNGFFHRGLFYAVIGGWLGKFLDVHKDIVKCLKLFQGIFVETKTMKQQLGRYGLNNVSIQPNFKDLSVLREDQLNYSNEEPYKLCTFSRVTPQKGIEDACNAVKTINLKAGRTVLELDIYGPIDEQYTDWFKNEILQMPHFIQYKGIVPYEKSVDALKAYFALLFPTRYYTEGIPGTIIDAYASGVPVISSKWESFSDVIDEGKTGYGYQFGDVEDLISVLNAVVRNADEFLKMKSLCINKAKSYTPQVALERLKQHIK